MGRHGSDAPRTADLPRRHEAIDFAGDTYTFAWPDDIGRAGTVPRAGRESPARSRSHPAKQVVLADRDGCSVRG